MTSNTRLRSDQGVLALCFVRDGHGAGSGTVRLAGNVVAAVLDHAGGGKALNLALRQAEPAADNLRAVLAEPRGSVAGWLR